MADMTLTKPAAGAQDIVNAQPDARLLLDFPAGDATLERSGDDLIFHFDDGSNLVLRDFYTSYTRENMPDFVIDGTPVSGQEFFAALNNEDLMPAAGPATASNADGGRFREYADDPLQVGVDRLGGLDLGSNRAFYPERDPWGGLREDGSSPLPNREPIVNLTGNVGVIEAGVHPGGNDPYAGEAIATGRVTATDDDGDPLTYGFIDAAGNRVTTIDAAHGSITIEQDGTFTYTLDNNDPDTNGLALGETATETFTVFVDDGRGGVVTRPITVTITGTNDEPELTITGSGQDVVEDGTQSVTGTFGVADPDSDAGTDQTFHIDSANDGKGTDGTRGEDGSTNATFTTDYGTLTLNPETGKWEYTLSNDSDAVQQLKEGDTRTETFTVTVTDEHGATSEQEITVTITGTNDAPVIESVNDLTLKETGVKPGGNEGTESGENVTPSGNEHKLTATGKVTADDVDSDNDPSSLDYKLQDADGNLAEDIETAYGTVHMGEDGTYTYELKDGAANHLAQGESVTETITVVVTDSHGATATKDVTVTIYGTNDKPTLSLDNTTLEVVESGVGRDSDGNVVENGTPEQENTEYTGKLTAGGTATGTDVDNGASLTYGLGVKGEVQYAEEGPVTSTGTYGDLTINPDGSYTYTLRDGELDSLSEGEPRSETFTIYVKDEHGAWDAKEITVNITGTNDRPEITAADNLVLKETGVQDGGNDGTVPGETVTPSGDEHKLTATGKVTADDVDSDNDASSLDYKFENGDSLSSTITTDYGTITIDAKGEYIYTLDNDAAHGLAQGAVVEETFTVVVTDRHGATDTQEITVTIYGTNDVPELKIENAEQHLTEDGDTPSVSGTFEVIDPDSDAGTKQTFQIEGDKNTPGEGTEGTRTTEGGTPATFTTDYGTLTLDPVTGEWKYELDNDSEAVQSLAKDETKTETFEVTVFDEHRATSTQTITVTITGTNDTPTLTLTAPTLNVVESGVGRDEAGNIIEGGTRDLENSPYLGKLTADGKAQGADVDHDASLTYGLGVDGTPQYADNGSVTATTDYGTLVLNADGSYRYELKDKAPEVDALNEGQQVHDTFTIYVKDEYGAWTSQELTVTITGTNDAPVIESVDNLVLKETGVQDGGNEETVPGENVTPSGDEHKLTATGKVTADDVDSDNDASSLDYKFENGDSLSSTITTDYGTITIDAKGEYIYTLDNDAAHGLAQGAVVEETFTVVVTDRHGATDTQEITVTIYGTNDVPELKIENAEQHLTEDGDTPSVSGTFEVIDPDSDAGTKQTFQIEGDKNTPGEGTEGTRTTEGGTPATFTTDYGTLTLDPVTGEWKYELDNDSEAVQSLAKDETKTETFEVTVFDEHRATSTQTITVTITGTNDTPTLTLTAPTLNVVESGVGRDEAGNIIEGGTRDLENSPYLGKLTADGKAQGADVDHDASLTYGLGVDGTPQYADNGSVTATTDYGTLVLNADGSYRYELKDKAPEVDALNEGQQVHDTFTIYVKDEYGAWTSQELTVTITGTNDAPVIESVDNLVLKETGVQDGGNEETVSGENVTPSGDEHKLTATGKVTADDVDSDNDADTLDYKFENGDSLSSTITTDYGTITIDAKGEYIYTLDNDAAHGLAQGASVEEIFTVVVTDRHGATDTQKITVTIYGTNDVPELKIKDAVQEIAEDATAVSGTFEVIDPDSDAGTAQTFQIKGVEGVEGVEDTSLKDGTQPTEGKTGGSSATFTTDYGTLTLNPGGTWEYKLDNTSEAVQALKDGETKTETFEVTVKDEHGATSTQTITVTIKGTNDTPHFVTDPNRLSVVEHGVGRVDENTFIDNTDNNPDNNGDENAEYTGGPFYADGKFTVSDVDHDAVLKIGAAHVTETNPDGTPKLPPADLGDAGYHDYTPGENDPGTTTIDGTYGFLEFRTDGSYTYTVADDSNEAVNKLAENETAHDTFLIYVRDENGAWTTKTLIVDVHGTNDRPTLTLKNDYNFETLEVIEAGQYLKEDGSVDHVGKPEAHGTAEGTDVDNGAQFTYALIDEAGKAVTKIVNEYGELIINSETGRYSFILYNHKDIVNELKAGDEIPFTYTIRVTDEYGAYDEKPIDILIKGSDDMPHVEGSSVSVKEFGVTNGGNVELSKYSNESNVQKIKVTDNDGDTEFTFAITNNGASDVGADGIQHLVVTGYGTYFLNTKTGEYWFELNNDSDKVNGLKAGEVINANTDPQLKLWVSVTDEDGLFSKEWFQVQITGTNDKPELTLENPQLSVTEDDSPSATGTIHEVKDPDKGDTHTFGLTTETSLEGKTPTDIVLTMKGEYGSLTIDKTTGEYTYTLDERAQALGQGVGATETFHVIVKDQNGAFDIKEVTVNITGTADFIKLDSTDAHVIEITEAGTVFGQQNKPNDAEESADGMFNVTPVDQPDGEGNHLHYGFMVNGEFHEGLYETQYGTLTIDSEGHYVFTLNEAANALPENVTEKLEDIELAVRDDRHPDDMFTTQKLEIYIHGSNDRPYFTDGEGNEITPNDDGEIVFTAQPDSSSAPLEESGNDTLRGTLTADDPDSNHNPGDLSFSILFDKNGDGKIDTHNELVQKVEGKYGILTLNQDGTYIYELTNPGELASLNPGQSLIESALADEVFDIRVTDPSGAYTDGKLTIDVTGTANVPVIKHGTLEVTEDNGMPDVALDGKEVTCKIPLDLAGLKDAADLEGEVTWTITPKEGSAIYGEISIDSDGNYIYTLTENGNKVIQELNVDSEPLHQTFTVKAETAGGKVVEKEITVTIKGTNDRPVLDADVAKFEGEVTREVFEEEGARGDMGEGVTTGVIFEGVLDNSAASDIDNVGWQYMLVDENGNPVSELTTEFGTITLTHTENKDGSITTSYTYTLNNESPKLTEALQRAAEAGETLFDKLGIVAVDPHGAMSEKEGTISIKINPATGSGPGPDDLIIDPNSDLNASVKEDGDQPGDPETNQATSVTGQLKAMWKPDTSHEGDPSNRVFGIEGEREGEQVQGYVAADGKYGYLVVDPVTGEYKYTLYNGEDGKSNPVQDLADGETVTETFKVMLNGEYTGKELVITIHGTNDAPTIDVAGSKLTGTLTEHKDTGWADMSVSGTVKGTDIDRPLVRDDEGNIQLDENDKPIYGDPETVTYKFSDKYNPANIDTKTVDGHIVYTLTIEGKGTVTLDSVTGEYTFTVDPKLGHIVVGKNEKVEFDIVAVDPHGEPSDPAKVTINLEGVNHAPTLKEDTLEIKVTEDATPDDATTTGGLTQTGDLNDLVEDDKGGLSFSVGDKTVVQGEYGTLVINKDGTYTYTLNNASDKVQGLDGTHPGTDTFTITVKDADGATVKIPVNVIVTGKSDAPQVTVGEVIKATEGSTESYEGHVIAHDKDAADQEPGALKYQFDENAVDAHNANAADGEEWVLSADGTELTTQYGTYTIDQDGKYTFELNNDADAVRKLAAGTLTEQKVTVVVTDAQDNAVTQDVTVNITGKNTAPDFLDDAGNRIMPDDDGKVTVEANTENSPLKESSETASSDATLTGKFGFADPDDGGSVVARFAIDANGKEIRLSDDGPTTIQGKYGTLVIQKDGSYTYTYTSDVLGEGVTASENFTLKLTDNYGASSEAQLVVNLAGTNDRPEITRAQDLEITESDDAITFTKSGTLVFTDADEGDAHTVMVRSGNEYNNNYSTVSAIGKYGTLVIDGIKPNGEVSYHYELTSKELGAGQTADEDFVFKVNDGHADSDDFVIRVTITGTNDAPVIEFADSELSVTEPDDATTTAKANGTLFFTDADISDVQHTVMVKSDGDYDDHSAAGRYGTLVIGDINRDTGEVSYSYTLTSKELGADQTATETFTIKVDDGNGGIVEREITVDVTGTNDAPEITSVDLPVITEPDDATTTATANGKLVFTDADIDDEHTVAVKSDGDYDAHSAAGRYGNLVISGFDQATGEVSYSYELTSKELGAGQTATETFTIKVDDGYGGTLEQPIVFYVTGTNDAPEIKLATAPVDGNAGSFSFSDVDVDDTHSLSVLIDGQKHGVDMGTGKCTVEGVGTFIFTSTGEKSWTYTFEPDKALTDTLRPGESGKKDFQIQVSDTHVNVSSENLSVSFEGTNAAPVLGTETDGAEGTLTVTDDGDLQYLAVLGTNGEIIARLDPAKATQDVRIDGHTVTFTWQDGSYTYELDGGNAHVGTTAEVSFSIQAKDNLDAVTSNPLTLQAEGTQNAAPTAKGGATGMELPESLVPDSDVSVKGGLEDSDPDGDRVSYSLVESSGTYGTLSLDADGNYTYKLDMSEENLARLAELGGKDVTETFTYTVIDGHGGASQGSITVTLKVPDGVSVVPVEPSEPEPSMPGTGNGDEHAGGDGLHNTDGSTTDQPGGTDNTDEGVHGTGNVSDGDGINGVGAHDAHGLDDGGNMPLNTGLLSRYGRGSMFGTDNLNNLDGDGADGLPHMDDGNTSGVEGLAAHAPSHALGTDDLAAHDWDANETDAGNGAANVAPAHAPLAFSGDGNADQLLGASPFTADDFGDQNIFGNTTQEVFSAPANSEGFYSDLGGLTEAGQLLEASDNSLDGVLAPSDAQPEGQTDLGLTSLKPGDDLGGGSMPGLVSTDAMTDSPNMALATGAASSGAEDNLAHHQAMHEVNHSNG